MIQLLSEEECHGPITLAPFDLAGQREMARLALSVCGGVGPLFGDGLRMGAGMGPLAPAVNAAVGAMIAGVIRLAGQRAHRRASRRIGETYIGPEAAYFNGAYYCWATWGVGLLGVCSHGGERAVLSPTIGMNPNRNYELRVLVPSGREDEAKYIARLPGSSVSR